MPESPTEYLIALRTSVAMSQADFAEYVGVPTAWVVGWEAGRTPIPTGLMAWLDWRVTVGHAAWIAAHNPPRHPCAVTIRDFEDFLNHVEGCATCIAWLFGELRKLDKSEE